jgi:hypothetical protein
MCNLPGMAVHGTRLIVVDCTSGLNRGCRAVCGEGTGHRRWSWWLWGEGVFCRFGGLAGEGAEAAVMAAVVVREVGVIDGTVVPKVGVPLWQDTVGVVAIDVRSQAPATPMSHAQAVETKPLCCSVHTHHVMWTTPSDDNCRQAVDGT